MEARTAATWRVEGVRQVAESAVLPETKLSREIKRRERGPAPPEGEQAERTTPVFRDFHYRVDDETGRIVVEVRDGLTGELIRQVPPEELLRVMRSIRQYLGMRVDRRI